MTPIIAILAGFCLASGCSKHEDTTTPPLPVPATKAPDTKPAESAAADMQKAADKTAADLKQAADKAAADVQTQANAAQQSADKLAADAKANSEVLTSKAQSTIDAVKKLIADKKPAEALEMLGQLAGAKLTPEQQATVDQLKQQIQALMQQAATSQATDKASEAVGNLLKKK